MRFSRRKTSGGTHPEGTSMSAFGRGLGTVNLRHRVVSGASKLCRVMGLTGNEARSRASQIGMKWLYSSASRLIHNCPCSSFPREDPAVSGRNRFP